jgi:hypothetical protein
MLNEVPGWVLRLNTWDLIGVIAYTQAFALFESLVFVLILVIVSVILPAKFFRNKFVAVATSIVILTTAWFILAHYQDDIIRLWGVKQFALWTGIYLLSIVGAIVLVFRFNRVENSINIAVQRLSVLSSIYIFLGVLSVVIVIIRNIS